MIFEGLPELPDDLAEAFECMKLAIMHHHRDNWREISMSDVRRTLSILDDLCIRPPLKHGSRPGL